MKERQLPFSAPMVRRTLTDEKTQTRRIMKPQPPAECSIHYVLGNESWLPAESRTPLRHHWEAWGGALFEKRPEGHLCGTHAVTCPYGQPGDRLWVREAWRVGKGYDDAPGSAFTSPTVWYEADGNLPIDRIGRYRHARFMPRWASRITLEVVAVRVERLQDISDADAIAEGLVRDKGGWRGAPDLPWFASPVAAYRSLWESINGDGSWDANPWVWVVEFSRIEQEAKAA